VDEKPANDTTRESLVVGTVKSNKITLRLWTEGEGQLNELFKKEAQETELAQYRVGNRNPCPQPPPTTGRLHLRDQGQ